MSWQAERGGGDHSSLVFTDASIIASLLRWGWGPDAKPEFRRDGRRDEIVFIQPCPEIQVVLAFNILFTYLSRWDVHSLTPGKGNDITKMEECAWQTPPLVPVASTPGRDAGGDPMSPSGSGKGAKSHPQTIPASASLGASLADYDDHNSSVDLKAREMENGHWDTPCFNNDTKRCQLWLKCLLWSILSADAPYSLSLEELNQSNAASSVTQHGPTLIWTLQKQPFCASIVEVPATYGYSYVQALLTQHEVATAHILPSWQMHSTGTTTSLLCLRCSSRTTTITISERSVSKSLTFTKIKFDRRAERIVRKRGDTPLVLRTKLGEEEAQYAGGEDRTTLGRSFTGPEPERGMHTGNNERRSSLMPPPKQKSLSAAPGIPDFRDDITKWNAAWEARFPVLNSIVGNLETLVAGSTLSPASAQQDLVHNYNTMRRLCRVQEQLRVFAVTSVLQPSFCWKRLTPAARKAHMLEGLLRTCSIEPIYGPNSRMLTCDIPLSSLESGNGEGFLTLLKRYLPDGESEAVRALKTESLPRQCRAAPRVDARRCRVSARQCRAVSNVVAGNDDLERREECSGGVGNK
ncbi:hypothetical protein C8R44DRAFT_747136 [Mycena epipterygia]|nr:hypothetical protein C8R44DRAFT_747136 [Mycena epipterygia]